MPDGNVEAIIKLDKVQADAIIEKQLSLNELGVFVRHTRRGTTHPADENYAPVPLAQGATLKEAVDVGRRLAGFAGIIRRKDGSLAVRVRIEHLASARAALLGADVKPLPAVMAVVGRQRYVLRGLPDVNPLVLAQKLADWG